MKKAFIALVVFSTYHLLPGRDGLSQDYSFVFEPKLSGELFIQNSSYNGSQFFMAKWLPGDVILTNGEVVHGKTLGYNGFEDEIIWLTDAGSDMVKLDKGLVSGFVLNPDPGSPGIVFNKILLKKALLRDTIELFAQSLYNSRISLFAHRRIVVGDVEKYNNNITANSRKFLEPKPVYHLFLPDKQVIDIKKIRRRNILSAFPDRKSEIKRALRANNIRVNNEDNLIKAVQIIDSII